MALLYFFIRFFAGRKDALAGITALLDDDMWILKRLFKLIKQQHPDAQLSGQKIFIPLSFPLNNKSTELPAVFFSVYVRSGQVFLSLIANIPFLCSDALPRESFKTTVELFLKIDKYEFQHVISEDTLTLFHVLKQDLFRRSVTTRDCFNRFSETSMYVLQGFILLYNNPLYDRLWLNGPTMPEHKKRTPVPEKEEQPSGTLDATSLISMYLKQNKDYYLRKFAKSDGSNFSAFWLGGFWFFYRKMVMQGFIYLVLLLGAYIVNMFFPYFGLIIGFILHVVLGLTANNIYRKHISKKIDRLRVGDNKAVKDGLFKQKDTSLLLFFAGWVVWVVMVYVTNVVLYILIEMIRVFASYNL